MKASRIGLMIGLILVFFGMALVVGQSALDFKWTHHPPETFGEVEDMEDQMKIATSLGLAGNIIVLIGVAIFVVVFMIEILPPAPTMARARVTRVCPSCGRVVDPDAKFCRHCGKALPE